MRRYFELFIRICCFLKSNKFFILIILNNVLIIYILIRDMKVKKILLFINVRVIVLLGDFKAERQPTGWYVVESNFFSKIKHYFFFTAVFATISIEIKIYLK
uniref:Uncharacterized protein n=1 Tax=Heterorhabditis bacteriophora TaxID=37862 RepID=A0A1I7WJG9_HETBA